MPSPLGRRRDWNVLSGGGRQQTLVDRRRSPLQLVRREARDGAHARRARISRGCAAACRTTSASTRDSCTVQFAAAGRLGALTGESNVWIGMRAPDGSGWSWENVDRNPVSYLYWQRGAPSTAQHTDRTT